MNEKRVLGAVFSVNLKEGRVTARSLAKSLGTDYGEVSREVDRLARRGLLEKKRGALGLTRRGRRKIKVAFIGGGFEVIHAGHLYTISLAKSLADVLVVVVARDSTIKRRKGRDPATPETERVKLLAALRDVDAAILGSEGSIYDTLEKVRPNLVALGYDQHHAEEEILAEAERRGIRLTVVRLDAPNPQVKTTKFLQEL